MKKVNKRLFLVLINSLLLVNAASCNSTSNINSSDQSSDVPNSSDDIDSEEEGILKNYLKNLNLKGYVGTNLKNNIKYWQASAYQNNPNIVVQIEEANDGEMTTSLASVLGTDYFGVESYYDISIVDKDNSKYIGWTMEYLPNSFGDRDFRFCNDPAAICDWTGAKELWIHIDASEISGPTSFRVAFEEDHIGRESFALVENQTVYLYNNGIRSNATIESGGYVPIPQEFVGYLAIPLDSVHYAKYWGENGNDALDLDNVVQFQLAVKGTSASIANTFYINDFAILGDVNGGSLPDGIESSYSYKIVWNIENLVNATSSTNVPSSLAWYGEFVGKLLTGIAFSYKAHPDESLVTAANSIIDDLFAAQGEDGYLGVYTGTARYSIGSSNWDLWNQYHAIVGLAEWYKITGNQKALLIAKKALDCIYNTFHERSYIVRGGFETNRGIAHGYAILYQITKEEKYLAEAERIILIDCQDDTGWYKFALEEKSFYTSSSARWEVLHMMMTLGILFEETKNQEYYAVMEFLWNDILATDIHNSGGFTTNEGAIGDPYIEGVIETCCTIAWAAFTNEYYKTNREVKTVDELERSYFNGLLGALTDDDKYCTYNTPVNGIQGTCGHYDGRRVKSQQDISFQFNSGSPDMNCCQANFARGIGQIAEWASLSDGPALYVNYYGTSSIETKVKGKDVTIKETTNYPLDGKVKLTISGLADDTTFDLKLRVPSWSANSTVNYDGNIYECTSGEYFSINKKWHNGDEVELNIGMQFTCWKGQEIQSDFTSVYYGPILLTLDEYNQNKSGSIYEFDRMFHIVNTDFASATISSGATSGAWMYVDVPVGNQSFIRLIDFASAGKYNGASQPSSYYSWLTIDNAPANNTGDASFRWKIPLF
ncbi:MAG: beta-L-arabinofuranosidase domain-containing protein [Bacilli bacterium]